MRVIAGSAKGTRLYAPSRAFRPTADRVKQVLFDILQGIAPLPPLVVDAFAGSGALGIEALSRGAAKVIFIEKSQSAVKYLMRNLKQTHLDSKAEVVVGDAFVFMAKYSGSPSSLIIADPPYGGEHTKALLHALVESTILQDSGVLVLEESRRTKLSIPECFTPLRDKIVGDSRLLFLQKNVS